MICTIYAEHPSSVERPPRSAEPAHGSRRGGPGSQTRELPTLSTARPAPNGEPVLTPAPRQSRQADEQGFPTPLSALAGPEGCPRRRHPHDPRQHLRKVSRSTVRYDTSSCTSTCSPLYCKVRAGITGTIAVTNTIPHRLAVVDNAVRWWCYTCNRCRPASLRIHDPQTMIPGRPPA